MKKRVTGIGGIFFKSENPQALREWYKTHLGIESESWGAVFHWKENDPTGEAATAWNPFPADTKYFLPSEHPYMINYRVENLEELMKCLADEGVNIVKEMEVSEFGKFAWIIDPEGRKIELWEQ